MTKKIMAVVLITENMSDATQFYNEKLGLKIKTQVEGFTDFDMEGTCIALLDKNIGNDLIGNSISQDKEHARPLILAWDFVENVDKIYSELLAKGVPFIVEPKTMPWGQRVAYFNDPDGNIWEISQM